MDRLEWDSTQILPGEVLKRKQDGIRLYDGDNKTEFSDGEVDLTSHRLIWAESHKTTGLLLQLRLIVFTEEEKRFGKNTKIIIHLNPPAPDKKAGPVQYSSESYIKLSFSNHGSSAFHEMLQSVLAHREWERMHLQLPLNPALVKGKVIRTGIGGIEKKMQLKSQQIDSTMSQAFEDLKNLMKMAKDMVTLSKSITGKIMEKQGTITDDETVQFKSYLLSLGIKDPVTRDSASSESKYYKELSTQVTRAMEAPVKDVGGQMSLHDIYCRINRARGMELISPQDLVEACKLTNKLQHPVFYREYDSGLKVLCLQSHNEQDVVQETTKLLACHTCLSAEDLSRLCNITVLLARERLLTTERHSQAVRDESTEGIKFYPNLFMTNEA